MGPAFYRGGRCQGPTEPKGKSELKSHCDHRELAVPEEKRLAPRAIRMDRRSLDSRRVESFPRKESQLACCILGASKLNTCFVVTLSITPMEVMAAREVVCEKVCLADFSLIFSALLSCLFVNLFVNLAAIFRHSKNMPVKRRSFPDFHDVACREEYQFTSFCQRQYIGWNGFRHHEAKMFALDLQFYRPASCKKPDQFEASRVGLVRIIWLVLP